MTVRLTYFTITGLGEPVRLMLSAAGIKFEDVRLTKKQWDTVKPTLKWPFLPMLEIDGKTLFQSRAICRYIARKAGLVGSEDDAVIADMTVDAMDDMRANVVKFYYTPDSPEREAGLKNAMESVIPLYLKNFQDQLLENNGYLVGGKLSWADIMLLSYIDYLNHILGRNLLADFSKLNELYEKIKLLPGIKEYLPTRPEQVKDYRTLFM